MSIVDSSQAEASLARGLLDDLAIPFAKHDDNAPTSLAMLRQLNERLLRCSSPPS